MAWKAWLAGLAALLAAGTASAQAPATPDPMRSSIAQRRALAAALEAGDKAAVTRAAIALATMGASLSEESFERIAPSLDPAILADRKAWPWHVATGSDVPLLKRMFRDNGVTAPERYFEQMALVPAEYRLVEGIAWDDDTRRLFIGTVVDGRLAYFADGKWVEVPVGSPRGGLFGMAIDAPRRLLWIATGSVEQTALAGARMTGLIALDLDTLAVVRRVPLEGADAGVVGDVAIGADGTVFASNSVSGAVHRCRPGCTTLETLVAPGTLRSAQGLVLSGDGKSLYVADYSTGPWIVDPGTGKARPVSIAQPTMLEGIDGLVLRGPDPPGSDTLIAIQNGTRPRRVLRLHIGRTPGDIGYSEAIAPISPDGPEPTLATQVDGALWFVADGQWERYGPGGVLKDGQPPRPTPILRVGTVDIIVTQR